MPSSVSPIRGGGVIAARGAAGTTTRLDFFEQPEKKIEANNIATITECLIAGPNVIARVIKTT
jgi:hypothetical protein